jgi:gliding motility-associated lipoprotein GldD
MRISISLLLILFCFGCGHDYMPKPKGYVRFDFPAKAYVQLKDNFPYSFEYPAYGKIVNDKEANTEPYWINIEFPEFKSKIHLSYKKVDKNLSGYIEDSHILAYKHAVKADGIDEIPVEDRTRKVYGLIYDIQGNAASSVQFYLTDSLHHFLRGSLYFEAEPNKDSLAPAITFFRKDIEHLIQTLHWNN